LGFLKIIGMQTSSDINDTSAIVKIEGDGKEQAAGFLDHKLIKNIKEKASGCMWRRGVY